MMEAFVYPVSAVMKGWHWLLADLLRIPADLAWVLSIILLVITVRIFMAPFTWSTFKSSRAMLMMRPEQWDLEERYGTSVDPDDVATHDQALKDLNKKYGYNPLTGCIPPLVQIPFIIGLYRLLIWMSVPENGRTGSDIGLLTRDDISSFLDASFMGVPLPAYVAMKPEHLEALGTTRDDTIAVAAPLLLCAIIFTTLNMFVSQLRSRVHMDWSQKASVKIYTFMWFFMLVTPVLLAFIGLTGLIPIALLMYWFINNLWTMSQTILMWHALSRIYPLQHEHQEHILRARLDHVISQRIERRARRDARRSKWGRRIDALAHPSSMSDINQEIKDEREAVRLERKEERLEKKALLKEKSKVRSDLRKAELQERRRVRRAAREEDARLNSPQAAPRASQRPAPVPSEGGRHRAPSPPRSYRRRGI